MISHILIKYNCYSRIFHLKFYNKSKLGYLWIPGFDVIATATDELYMVTFTSLRVGHAGTSCQFSMSMHGLCCTKYFQACKLLGLAKAEKQIFYITLVIEFCKMFLT